MSKARERMFQSLYRGTAFATQLLQFTLYHMESFNPSIEGQPLQPLKVVRLMHGILFQSLYRGTAFATVHDFWWCYYRINSFNPSIEGQPLQQSRCRSLYFQ